MSIAEHVTFLTNIEAVSKNSSMEDFYLWPRTPITHDHQAIIAKRVSSSDLEVTNNKSRPSIIIKQLHQLINSRKLNDDFSILDIACGDAIVLWQIKKAFPNASCYGIDCNKGQFGTHDAIQKDGVILYNIFLQHLFKHNLSIPFHVVLMLNTYRGWEHADLREHERNLPALADTWFNNNAIYTFLTATTQQIRSLKSTFSIDVLGKGEDNSKMILLSKKHEYTTGSNAITKFLANLPK